MASRLLQTFRASLVGGRQDGHGEMTIDSATSLSSRVRAGIFFLAAASLLRPDGLAHGTPLISSQFSSAAPVVASGVLLLPGPGSEETPVLLLASDGGGGGGGRDSLNTFSQSRTEVLPGSEATVIRLEREMQQAQAVCSNLPPEYQADCLQQSLGRGASVLNEPAYSQARREISRAQRSIDRLVSRNIDRSKPPIRVNGRVYRAVKKTAVAKVNREARRIVAETETKLLRSAGTGKRKTHYTRIARAVGSTKNLLRS